MNLPPDPILFHLLKEISQQLSHLYPVSTVASDNSYIISHLGKKKWPFETTFPSSFSSISLLPFYFLKELSPHDNSTSPILSRTLSNHFTSWKQPLSRPPVTTVFARFSGYISVLNLCNLCSNTWHNYSLLLDKYSLHGFQNITCWVLLRWSFIFNILWNLLLIAQSLVLYSIYAHSLLGNLIHLMALRSSIYWQFLNWCFLPRTFSWTLDSQYLVPFMPLILKMFNWNPDFYSFLTGLLLPLSSPGPSEKMAIHSPREKYHPTWRKSWLLGDEKVLDITMLCHLPKLSSTQQNLTPYLISLIFLGVTQAAMTLS